METTATIKENGVDVATLELPRHNIFLEGDEIYEGEVAYYVGKYEIGYELRVDASYVHSSGDWYTPGSNDLKKYDITIGNIQFGFRNDDAFELTDRQYDLLEKKLIQSLNII